MITGRDCGRRGPTDQPLGCRIWFWRGTGDDDLAHPQAFHPTDEHIAVDRIPVAEQVFGRCLFWEALDKLVSGPGGGGVVGGVDMDEFPDGGVEGSGTRRATGR